LVHVYGRMMMATSSLPSSTTYACKADHSGMEVCK
jgi:hypothetical protein